MAVEACHAQREQQHRTLLHRTDAKGKAKAPKAKSPQVPEVEKEKDRQADKSAGAPAGSLAMFSHLPPHLRMTAQVAVKKSDVRIHFLVAAHT